ncbi:hypothetical protein ACE5IS_13325 [Leptospira wolffii]|uniref:Uncharacterized protein n=1 Tax=Leptospira wolffii TaxID=409998 RepID=A0ABV5BQ24_9LEPT
MNVTNIQTGTYSPQWSPPAQEPVKESEQTLDHVTISFDGMERARTKSIKRPELEDLVMKPTPLTTEERLSQVISPEQMKDLLSMIVRSKFNSTVEEGKTGHKFDRKG